MKGLTVAVHDDGTWLNFKTNDGRWVTMCVESIADEKEYKGASVMSGALRKWCEEVREEIRQFTTPAIEPNPSIK